MATVLSAFSLTIPKDNKRPQINNSLPNKKYFSLNACTVVGGCLVLIHQLNERGYESKNVANCKRNQG